MINVNEMFFSYKKDIIFDNFNYSFNDSGLYSIIGESGCGKTTLLNLIAGILKPKSGSITYSEDIKDIKSSISLIFQDNNLFDNLSVIDNVRLLTRFKTENINDELIENTLDRLGILKYKDKLVSNISGGERQRVSIAIALLLDKKVILADEPLASLDYTNSKKILSFFKEISKDKLIIFSSHNVDILNEFCDEIINLEVTDYDSENYPILSQAIEKGKNISFKDFLFTYKNVLVKKLFIKIIAVIFLFFSISILATMLSLSQINYDKVTINQLERYNNPPTFIEPNQMIDGSDEETQNYLKDNNFKYNRVIIPRGDITGFEEVPFEDSVSDFIYAVIDESLEDYEIKISNSLAKLYLDYGLLPKNLSIDSLNNYEYEVDALDFNNKNIKLKIKELNSDFDVYDEYNQILKYRIYLNSYTYSSLRYWENISKKENKFYIEDEEYSYGFNIGYTDTLKENEISLSLNALKTFEKINEKKYNIGDKIKLKAYFEDEKEFVLKEIANSDLDDRRIVYYSDKRIADYLSYTIEDYTCFTDGYILTDYNVDQLISLKNELKKNLCTFYSSNVVKDECVLLFIGSQSGFQYYTELNSLFKMSGVILIVFGTLALLFSLYYIMSTYSINRNKFLILELYGMKKIFEFLLLEFDLLIVFLISTILATPLYLLINELLNSIIIDMTKIDYVYNLFNFGNEMLSFIILFIFMNIILFICYFISSSKKIKTHIDN